MSPKRFTFVNSKGESETLPERLVPLASAIAPLATAAIKGETVVEQSFRSIAELIGQNRMNYKFAGDKAGSTRGLGAMDFDYRGLSPECGKDEDMIWSAVVPAAHLAQWMAATRKAPSQYPLRNKVQYHLEIVIKELFAKNNPTVDGEVESNGNMTGDLAELFTAQTGLAAADRTSRSKGKTANKPVMDPKGKPGETLKTVGGVFGQITAESLSGIHGSERRVMLNQIKAIRLHAETLLADLTSSSKPVVDKRRVRAADAA